MKAGRELDVKVAEALGFRIYEDFPVCAIYTGDTPTSFRVFRPSVEWTSMGVLVEEAVKQGFPFQIETRFMDGGLIDYRCLSIGEDRDIVHGFGDTAPQAVCRAFLKAKGIAI